MYSILGIEPIVIEKPEASSVVSPDLLTLKILGITQFRHFLTMPKKVMEEDSEPIAMLIGAFDLL